MVLMRKKDQGVVRAYIGHKNGGDTHYCPQTREEMLEILRSADVSFRGAPRMFVEMGESVFWQYVLRRNKYVKSDSLPLANFNDWLKEDAPQNCHVFVDDGDWNSILEKASSTGRRCLARVLSPKEADDTRYMNRE